MGDFFAAVAAIFGTGIITIFIVALVFGLSFLFTAGLIWVVCWCFGWAFSWPLALGVWIIILILRSIFSNHNTNK